MLRITDLRRAVAERGFPPGLSAEVHLAVEDPLVPGNAGRWVLRVAGGRGLVAHGPCGRAGSELSDWRKAGRARILTSDGGAARLHS